MAMKRPVDGRGYDVVIVGGGVIGSAIAYFLEAEPAFDGTVLVVEKDPTYEGSSTARSAGSIRQQYSTEENILISRFGAQFLKAIDVHLSVDGETPELGFVEAGYLFLAGGAELEALRRNHALQRRCGADVALLWPADLEERFPWLTVDDVAAGCLGLSDEGWFDPEALLHGFRRKARALGARYVEDEAVGLVRAAGGVRRVTLRSGAEVACGTLVNAAGPRAAALAAMAGLQLPVRPRKRLVFFMRCMSDLAGCPLVIDASGLFFRPEGDGFICGIGPPPEEDPDCLDFEVDYGVFEERIWPLLAARVAAFEAVKMVHAWAGHYAYNTFDQNAILGPHPDVENFLFANGFSGHGLQQSPAVGRAIAELITFGEFRSLDLTRLSYDRLVSGKPLLERNII